MRVAVAAQPGVLPVDVETVEVVTPDERRRRSRRTGPRDSGVSAASEKPPDQIQPPTETRTLSCGWFARRPVRILEVLRIQRRALHDLPVRDVGERVVDVGQLVGRDPARVDHASRAGTRTR